MYLLIGIVVLIIAAAIGVWLYIKNQTKGKERGAPVAQISAVRQVRDDNLVSVTPANGDMNAHVAPVPITQPPPEMTFSEGTVVTERKLLEMSKMRAPHPKQVFTQSRLQKDANPFIGDLKIQPRTDGIQVPYITEVDTLMRGGYYSF